MKYNAYQLWPIFLIFFLSANQIHGEEIKLDQTWYYSTSLNTVKDWKTVAISQSLLSQDIFINQGEVIFFKTIFQDQSIFTHFKNRAIALKFRDLENVTGISLNGSLIFQSTTGQQLFYIQIPVHLIRSKNELIITLRKNYWSPDHSPSFSSIPSLDLLQKAKEEINRLNTAGLILIICFLFTAFFIFINYSSKLGNYEYLLISLLSLSFAFNMLFHLPLFNFNQIDLPTPIKTFFRVITVFFSNTQPLIGVLLFKKLFKVKNSWIDKLIQIFAFYSILLNGLEMTAVFFNGYFKFHYYLFNFFVLLIFILYLYLVINQLFKKEWQAISLIIGILIFIFSWLLQEWGCKKPILACFYLELGYFCFTCALAFYLAWQFRCVNLHLRELNITLEDKVDHRTKKLQKMTEERTNFFINLAHEIKTPVQLIKSYLARHMALHGSSEDLQVVSRNIACLERNMNNYMQIEKIIKNERQIYQHNSICELGQIIKQVISNYPAHMLQLDLAESIYLKANPAALKRLLDNILINSIKYNDESVQIKIDLKQNEQTICLKISDNGIGIPASRLKHIFKPFYQLPQEQKNIQGIGLGLCIVQNIIQSLDGTIEVKSEVNQGLCFIFCFKAIQNSADQAIITTIDPPSAKPAHFLPETRTITDSDYQPDLENILIVEDNLDTLHYLKEILISRYNVSVAVNGKKALYKLDQLKAGNCLPRLIISDIMMDEMDGYQLLDQLKKDENFCYIPILFLTAKASPDDEYRGFARGAVAYLTKPFSSPTLLAAIEANLSNRDSLLDDYEKTRFNEQFFHEKCDQIGLTNMQREVVRYWIIYRLSQDEIGKKLGKSRRMIEKHVHNIKQKMGINDKANIKRELGKLFRDFEN